MSMPLFIQRAVFATAVLVLWHLSSGVIVSEFFISSPVAVLSKLITWIMNGTLLFHTYHTVVVAVVGFLCGAVVGMSFGILLGRMQKLSDLLDPFILGFYSLPKVALAPLFVLWFGIGMSMKIILVAVIVFFLVFLNTYTGVRNVSRDQITILRLMDANERHILFKVILPSAFSWVFAGLRLSVPYALIGAIVGEMIASNRGLGYLLADASGQFDTGGVFAALIACVVLGIALNGAVRLGERKLMPWKAVEDTRELSI